MTELLTFSTDNLGRIRLDRDPESPAARGISNECCCRNQHQPLDGYISTDPGCKVHGLTRIIVSPVALQEEEITEARMTRMLEADYAVVMAARKKQADSRRASNIARKLAAAASTGQVIR